LRHKDQDQDLGGKDQDKDQDFTVKDKDQDTDYKSVLKDYLRIRTRTSITAYINVTSSIASLVKE